MSVEYQIKDLDHLGIVAGICDKIGLVEIIDEYIGPQKRKVSVGIAVKAMILNGLGISSRFLYLTPEYYSNKPIEFLLGKGICAEDLNDDSLGRALDVLFEKGQIFLPSSLMLLVISLGFRPQLPIWTRLRLVWLENILKKRKMLFILPMVTAKIKDLT